MNLQDEWNRLSSELDQNNSEFRASQQMIRQESKGIYETLLKRLGYKLMYIAAFTVMALMLALMNSGDVRMVYLSFLGAYFLGGSLMVRALKKMPQTTDYTAISKSLVEEQLQRIRRVLRLERYWGYVFIPLSCLGGFLVSRLYSGENLNVIMQDTNWWYMLPMFLILSLGAIGLAEKMNRIAFKGYMDKLMQHQEALKDDLY